MSSLGIRNDLYYFGVYYAGKSWQLYIKNIKLKNFYLRLHGIEKRLRMILQIIKKMN